MTYLVDTNILVRFSAPDDPMHQLARTTIDTFEKNGIPLVTAGQNLIELWNVATRPAARNGLGLSLDVTESLVARFEEAFPRLPDPANVFDRWRGLVVRFGVSGAKVHDARLVAVMQGNRVSTILTFNARDFHRYARVGIHAIDPREL